jgi:hypothetical protein
VIVGNVLASLSRAAISVADDLLPKLRIVGQDFLDREI